MGEMNRAMCGEMVQNFLTSPRVILSAPLLVSKPSFLNLVPFGVEKL